jgi:hypothetical protein
MSIRYRSTDTIDTTASSSMSNPYMGTRNTELRHRLWQGPAHATRSCDTASGKVPHVMLKPARYCEGSWESSHWGRSGDLSRHGKRARVRSLGTCRLILTSPNLWRKGKRFIHWRNARWSNDLHNFVLILKKWWYRRRWRQITLVDQETPIKHNRSWHLSHHLRTSRR